ncbi:MAG: DUF4435 domain-containing protein [Paraprevotella sp.]|nr:DUF4435 domain-containing protein [Paraprevotella sp.]
MAKRWSEHLNSQYLGAAQKLKPKTARRKIVAYVESYDDVSLWRTVLDDFEDDTRYFEVMLPSRSTLGKGKKIVLMNELGPKLGNYMIACVDADYDYLLQDTTPTSRLINGNPFVFHTYAYAIENYQCYAETLHRVCVMATLNDRQIIDFEGFMRDYSQIIWPLFVWSIWAYRHNHYREFTMTEFGHHVSFGDINVYHPEFSLDFVRRKVNRKISWLQRHFPQAKKEYEKLKQELQELGVTPDTTYLYIQGHTLFDNVVTPLLEPVCVLLRKEREREIRSLAEHEVQRQNELSCYQHSQNSVEGMLRKNVGFKSAPPYLRLQSDIECLLERMDAEVMQKTCPAS